MFFGTNVKCKKLVMMEAQTFFNFGTSTCFMDKELVQQYNFALVEKNTLVLVAVIDGRNHSSGPVTPMKPSH